MEVLNFYKVGLKIPENAIYIGRPNYKFGLKGSKYHNPFKRDDPGDPIEKYRNYLWKEIKSGRITIEELANLEGLDLVCYCKPKACHGDILLAAIKWASQEYKKSRKD